MWTTVHVRRQHTSTRHSHCTFWTSLNPQEVIIMAGMATAYDIVVGIQVAASPLLLFFSSTPTFLLASFICLIVSRLQSTGRSVTPNVKMNMSTAVL